MGRKDKSREELLLDWHLRRLDDSDRAWIEEELGRDAALRAKKERLGQVLQPLDSWQVSPAPPNLVDKILAQVERSTRDGEVPKPVPLETGGAGRSPLVSLRDLVAIAACILLLIGVFVPGLSKLRDRSQRTMCAGNLGSIFRGLSTYQEAFDGALPFAGSPSDASWLPVGARTRPYASNSRHAYLLVKLEFGPIPRDFICPACGKAKPMGTDGLAAHDDFPRSCNIGYDSLNLAGSAPNVRPIVPVPYMSDRNPLFVNARFNPSVDPDRTNSPAHGGKGQTVLALDGSAKWMTTPIYGVKKDNLWLIGNIRRYTGIEVPIRHDDVQLVPGYPTTDPDVSHVLKH